MNITIVQGAFLPVPPLRGGAIEKAFHSLAKQFSDNGHTTNYISRLCDRLPSRESEGPKLHHTRVPGFNSPKSSLLLKFLDFVYSSRVIGALPTADILVTHTFWLPILINKSDTHGKLYVHVGRVPKGQMRFYKNAARLQTVSTPIVEAIKRETPQVSHEKVKMIPYPLESNFLANIDFSKPRPKRILYAGRIHPEKGLDILIDAFLSGCSTSFKDWTLDILGPWEIRHGGGGDRYLSTLKAKVSGVKGINFLDPVFSQNELASIFERASIFVYPSLAEKGETFGLAALEAMARGCLTVVSSLDCFKDFVESGRNGFIFNHREVHPDEALYNSLVSLTSKADEPHFLRVRVDARSTAEEYTSANISKLFLDDFQRILVESSQ